MGAVTTKERVAVERSAFEELKTLKDWSIIAFETVDALLRRVNALPHSKDQEKLFDDLLEFRLTLLHMRNNEELEE